MRHHRRESGRPWLAFGPVDAADTDCRGRNRDAARATRPHRPVPPDQRRALLPISPRPSSRLGQLPNGPRRTRPTISRYAARYLERRCTRSRGCLGSLFLVALPAAARDAAISPWAAHETAHFWRSGRRALHREHPSSAIPFDVENKAFESTKIWLAFCRTQPDFFHQAILPDIPVTGHVRAKVLIEE